MQLTRNPPDRTYAITGIRPEELALLQLLLIEDGLPPLHIGQEWSFRECIPSDHRVQPEPPSAPVVGHVRPDWVYGPDGALARKEGAT